MKALGGLLLVLTVSACHDSDLSRRVRGEEHTEPSDDGGAPHTAPAHGEQATDASTPTGPGPGPVDIDAATDGVAPSPRDAAADDGPGGVLDPRFGTDGKTRIDFGGDRSDMAVQADDAIVVVGGTFTAFVMARFKADGTLDSGFGDGGTVKTELIPGEQQESLGVAVQKDGKIVVVGYVNQPSTPPAEKPPAQFALARYDAQGKLDPSFGNGGTITSGVTGLAYDVAIDDLGKILVVGDLPINTTSDPDWSDLRIARFDTNGTLEEMRQIDVGGAPNLGRNIVLQPDGKIVVSGQMAQSSFGASGFVHAEHTDVVRLAPSLNLDGAFGVAGSLTLPDTLAGEGLALQEDGKLVLVGSLDVSAPGDVFGTASDFYVTRLNGDGTLDQDFGDGGGKHVSVSGERDGARAVTLQKDGRIVVAGNCSNIDSNFAVLRFTSEGVPDGSFANGGSLQINFGRADIAESIALQSDGALIVSGLARGRIDGYGVAKILP